MNNLLDDIARSSIRLMLKEPFYGHYLSTITRHITEQISTMGVATDGQKLVTLYVNPDFWNEVLTTEDYRYGVLKHEILHIVFKHILLTDQFEFKDLANIAMDMVVNQYIDHEHLPLSPIIIENYPDLQLERDKDIHYYYQKLLSVYRGQSHSDVLPQLQLDLEKFSGDHQIGDHRQWKRLSAGEQEFLKNNINLTICSILNRSSKNASFGNLPKGLKDYLQFIEQSAKPFINWKRTIRLFASSSEHTYLKNTIRRPSKRYGTTPGLKVKRKNKLLIAIDTSGSISNHELMVFFGEIYHIYRQGAEIMIVECDTKIQNHYLYRGKAPQFITGRGGTDFNEPIRFANEVYHPDAIIYFTDGYATAPKLKSRSPILWMITQEGVSESDWNILPGRKVKMIKLTTINA